MKKYILAVIVTLAMLTPAYAQQTIAESSQGHLWWTQVNEVIMDSKIADASKFRVGAPFELNQSGGGGAFSFDVIGGISGAGNGRRIEVVLLTGGMNRNGGGETGLFVTRRGTWGNISDAAQIRVYEATSDGIDFKVPVTFSAGVVGGGGGGITDTMWAPSGMFFTQQQADGNFVTYRTPVPFSKTAPGIIPVWSAWTGKL